MVESKDKEMVKIVLAEGKQVAVEVRIARQSKKLADQLEEGGYDPEEALEETEIKESVWLKCVEYMTKLAEEDFEPPVLEKPLPDQEVHTLLAT